MKIIPEPSTQEPPPFQFSLRTLLIGVTIFCVFMGLLVPAVRSAREAAGLKQLDNQFKQISLALQLYVDVHGRLPDGSSNDMPTKPISSWRFKLLPYLESLGINNPVDFNAAWDDPVNSQYCNSSYSFFCVPCKSTKVGPRETQILAVTGPGTAFEDGKTCKHEELPNDLFIIVETRNSGFHWMEPGDLDIRTMPRTINAPDGHGIAANIGDRFHVIFADGTVWQLSADVSFEDIEKFLTIDGATQHDRDEVLGPYQ